MVQDVRRNELSSFVVIILMKIMQLFSLSDKKITLERLEYVQSVYDQYVNRSGLIGAQTIVNDVITFRRITNSDSETTGIILVNVRTAVVYIAIYKKLYNLNIDDLIVVGRLDIRNTLIRLITYDIDNNRIHESEINALNGEWMHLLLPSDGVVGVIFSRLMKLEKYFTIPKISHKIASK